MGKKFNFEKAFHWVSQKISNFLEGKIMDFLFSSWLIIPAILTNIYKIFLNLETEWKYILIVGNILIPLSFFRQRYLFKKHFDKKNIIKILQIQEKKFRDFLTTYSPMGYIFIDHKINEGQVLWESILREIPSIYHYQLEREEFDPCRPLPLISANPHEIMKKRYENLVKIIDRLQK